MATAKCEIVQMDLFKLLLVCSCGWRHRQRTGSPRGHDMTWDKHLDAWTAHVKEKQALKK